MLTPTPTQQKPDQKVKATAEEASEQPSRKPLSKRFLHGLVKLMYYAFRGIGNHKSLTAMVIVLLLASISITNYVVSRQLPFGIGSDQFNFHIHGGNGGGDLVKDWLYALRDGNATALKLLDTNIQQPPDPNQIVANYSERIGHVDWKDITVIGVYSETDTTVDSFVEVDIVTNGPGGPTNGIMIWHFTTVATSHGEVLFNANLVDLRPKLA